MRSTARSSEAYSYADSAVTYPDGAQAARYPIPVETRARAEAAGLPFAGSVAPSDAWSLHSAGLATLVDVRTAEERKFVGHVPDTLHVLWATGTQLTRNPRFVRDFAATLPATRELLDTDVEAAYRCDPAARSVDEVLLCYPGVLAIIHHRLSHTLYRLGAPLIARIIAEIAHSATGIDIHPGAQIGGSFFIDHGTGVVIGETAVIGERVRLYQAVTLGAKRFQIGSDGLLQKACYAIPSSKGTSPSTLVRRCSAGSRSAAVPALAATSG
jgi:hypothetical protein